MRRSADAEDKDGFALLQLCFCEQHPPSGEIVDAKSRGLSEVEIVGDGEPIFGRNAHKLGHRSITMLAQKAHFGAQHRFASLAEFATPADDAWIKRNPTADQCTGIGFFDDARAVNAHDLR